MPHQILTIGRWGFIWFLLCIYNPQCIAKPAKMEESDTLSYLN